MRYRKFGNSDLAISEIGLGGSHFGSIINQKDPKEIVKTLEQAFESGINFYDTADIYGQGESEKLLGKTFKRCRDKVVIASKVGFCLSPTGSIISKIKPFLKPLIRLAKPMKKSMLAMRGSQIQQNFSPSYLIPAVEASLKRLKTDYLDVLQLHEPSSSVFEEAGTLAALEALKSQGKIRHYGVACNTAEETLACLRYPGFSSVQVEINLLNQTAISRLLPLAKEQQIGVIARQPFASGRIIKLLLDDQASKESFDQEAWEKREQLRLLANQKGISYVTQVALQFVLQFEAVSVVVAGMSNRQHLGQNLSALDPLSVAQSDLSMLTDVSQPT